MAQVETQLSVFFLEGREVGMLIQAVSVWLEMKKCVMKIGTVC